MMSSLPNLFGVFIALVAIPVSVVAQAPQLAFVESEVTGQHIALQPQKDHHRIYTRIQIRNGAGMQFQASLVCRSRTPLDDGSGDFEDLDPRATGSTVRFWVLKDNQTWAVSLRTPKKAQQTARYILKVDPSPRQVGTQPTTAADPSLLVYTWSINRRPDGRAIIQELEPGQQHSIQYPVSLPSKERLPSGEIEWRIISEVRVVEVDVPDGFKFGVDQRNSARDIYYAARPEN